MKLTHLDLRGKLRMVDISGKTMTARAAVAQCLLRVSAMTRRLVEKNALKKGDALAVAKIAGIAAAKKTAETIPLAHQVRLTFVDVGFEFEPAGIRITAVAKTDYSTGVEMEALSAAAAAALTLYDMLKAVERGASVEGLRLIKKTGGKSDFSAAAPRDSEK